MGKFLFLLTMSFQLACLTYAQTPVSLSSADTSRTARYYLKGKQFAKAARYDSAVYNFEKALAELKAARQEESLQCADIYASLGVTCYAQGNYQQAIQYYNQGLRLREKLSGESEYSAPWFYNSIGNANYLIGNFDEAHQYYQQVLHFASRPATKNNRMLATSYNNIGMIFFEKRNYKKSLEYFQKALTLYQQLYGNEDIILTSALNNIGLCHWKLYEIDEAIDYFRKALKIRKKSYGENHPAVAGSYHYLGEAYRLKNDVDSALSFYQKSLKINKNLFGEHHPKFAEDYMAMGTLLAQNDRYLEALQFFQKALLALVPSFSDTNFYHNPPVAERLSDKYLIYTLIHKARALSRLPGSPEQKMQSLRAAMDTHQLAAELVDSIILGYSSDASKLYLAGYEQDIAENALETLDTLYALTGDQRYRHQQFKFAQKSKFAILQKSLHDARTAHVSGIPDTLLQLEKQIRADISYYDTELQKEAKKKNDRDSLRMADFQGKSFALKQEHKNLIDRLEQEYPRYFHLKYRPREVAVGDIQTSLAPDEMLLDYFVTGKTVRIFAISRTDFDMVTVAIDTSFLPVLKAFQKAIKTVDVSRFADYSHQLYRLLIQPVEKQLAGRKKLVIIPHLDLCQIPFEAIICQPLSREPVDFSQADYLINQFEISYYPSSELFLSNTTGGKIAFSQESEKLNGFVGFAPVFNKESKTETIFAANIPVIREADIYRSVSIDGKHFAALEYSKSELDGIARLFSQKGLPAAAYFYAEASEEKFRKTAGLFNFVHIASHGIINNDNPNLSGVIFAQPADSSAREDGILYASETYNLNLNADLLVLSSCESGIGKLVRGEGLLSLARGFIYSGARNLVVSLWKVPDKHTSELMIEFYRSILAGNSYSYSLRQAKQNMIRNAKTAFPKFWSGFILIGG